MEQHRVATTFSPECPEGYDESVPCDENYPTLQAGLQVSDTGEVWRDAAKGIAGIDTPRTKVVYGALGADSNRASIFKSDSAGIGLTDMAVSCSTDFGVIALSSLTDEPICKSDNMLLSAIGRARNTDAVFDGEKMLDVGKPPILAEVIQAEVSIRTEIGDKLRVWGVNAEGFYAGQLPTEYKDGVMTFRIGDEENPACYYLIVKE